MPDVPTPDDRSRARGLLAAADRVLVLTGAGVSQESGVPTFRGSEGLWRHFRSEELATADAFARHPTVVWSWYQWRRRLVAACRPNAAHQALARRLAARRGWTLVTQNVDGLHELATAEVGGDATAVLALHGALFASRCTRCDYRRDEPRDAAAYVDRGARADDPALDEPPPPCPRCGAHLRPDVVWFGESLDSSRLDLAWRAAELASVCLVVGTSGVVQPAASLAGVTRAAGGRVIEVNPEPTALTPLADVALRTPAAELLPTLLADHPGADAARPAAS